MSRLMTKEYTKTPCRNWFNITTPPDVESINKLGGYDISYPRLALIDGRQDPWRAGGAHAIGQPDRKSTTSEPFLLVDWGVHHWDEFGMSEDFEEEGLPPPQVVENQQKQVEFVKAWLKEWHDEHAKKLDEDDDEAGEL